MKASCYNLVNLCDAQKARKEDNGEYMQMAKWTKLVLAGPEPVAGCKARIALVSDNHSRSSKAPNLLDSALRPTGVSNVLVATDIDLQATLPLAGIIYTGAARDRYRGCSVKSGVQRYGWGSYAKKGLCKFM